jgi:hypothetical protein
MTDSNAKHFELKETKLNHDLEHGQQVDTSMLLLAEVHKNPEEFRALVKRSMDMPESQKASAKFHLNVDKNGVCVGPNRAQWHVLRTRRLI